MRQITLNRDELYDKTFGCWLGKSIGGTLGMPLEGQKGLFDLTYYDPVPDGAIFNDDLDIQLVWLRALQSFGPDVTTRELGEMWLKHVVYHWDEYGNARFSMRKGLLPPVSGAFNNWFVDCEGSPIRSEIWAMMAPACPDVAARYAYQDAIIDHAGGEGVWGEMYLAALESAAFVVDDPHELIEIGLSLIPPDCRTALAVKDVLEWHRDGVSWTECRELLLEEHGHYNPQDSPQNQGIVTLGWLYGEGDFGDSILKAVNCGEDTDCTGATLGSIMGIVHGADAIPSKWKDPVSAGIEVGWGIVGLDYPTDLHELTVQTLEMAEKVRAAKTPHVRVADAPTAIEGMELTDLRAPQVRDEVEAADPMTAIYDLGPMSLHVSYHGTPTIGYEGPSALTLALESQADVPMQGTLEVQAPHKWQVSGGGRFDLAGRGDRASFECAFAAERADVKLQVSNPITIRVAQQGQDPQVIRVPLLGERAWLVCGPFACDFGGKMGPENDLDPLGEWTGRDGNVCFEYRSFPENQMPLADMLDGRAGIVYAMTYAFVSVDTQMQIGFDNNDGIRVYLDGDLIGDAAVRQPARPVRHRVDVELTKGWHQIMVKVLGGEGAPDFHCYLTDPKHHGLTEIINTYLPDEIAEHFDD